MRVTDISRHGEFGHHDGLDLELTATHVRVPCVCRVDVAAGGERVGLLHTAPFLEVQGAINGDAIVGEAQLLAHFIAPDVVRLERDRAVDEPCAAVLLL